MADDQEAEGGEAVLQEGYELVHKGGAISTNIDVQQQVCWEPAEVHIEQINRQFLQNPRDRIEESRAIDTLSRQEKEAYLRLQQLSKKRCFSIADRVTRMLESGENSSV